MQIVIIVTLQIYSHSLLHEINMSFFNTAKSFCPEVSILCEKVRGLGFVNFNMLKENLCDISSKTFCKIL